MFDFIMYKIKVLNSYRQWRKRNPNNHSSVWSITNLNCIKVGNGTYGTINAEISRPDAKLIIGNYCSIGKNSFFLLCIDHPTTLISSYPFKSFQGNKNEDAISKGDIIVDDDVWICHGSIILSGVHVGQGAVIAAGSVVSKDVPPYAVVGGVPAKVIKYRFTQPVIDYLLTFDYGALTDEMIRSHIDSLYKSLDSMSLEEIKVLYSWFPKKKN